MKKIRKLEGITGYLDRKVLALDIETSGFNPRKDKIIGLSASDGITSYYWQWKDLVKSGDNKMLFKLLLNPIVIKIFHNAKFEFHFFLENGLKSYPVNYFDTMIASHICDENKFSHSLKNLAPIIDPNAKDYDKPLDDYKKAHNITSYADIPLRIIKPYASKDAFYTYGLYEFFIDKINKQFKTLFYDIEMPLIPVIVEMEKRGVPIDKKFFKKQGIKLLGEERLLEKLLHKTLGKINLLSNPEVGQALVKLGVDLPKTDKGAIKIDRYTLDSIDHPICKEITRYRQISHIRTTYCEGIPEKAEEGILYCDFRQMGARTGRFSAANPNLQNIPRDLEDIRKGFLVRKGYTNYYLDYSQIEMILLAHYTQDDYMVKTIKEGGDLHTATAIRFHNTKEPTKEQRRIAKHLNFAVVYGMGIKGLTRVFKTTPDQARKFLTHYYELSPKIKEFRYEATSRAKVRGFVMTLFGRYRRLHPEEAYKAVNAIIQGSAADIIKIAMIRINNYLKEYKLDANLLISVHDELHLEISNQTINQQKDHSRILEDIVKLMIDFKEVSLPLSVSIGRSKTNWKNKEAIDL